MAEKKKTAPKAPQAPKKAASSKAAAKKASARKLAMKAQNRFSKARPAATFMAGKHEVERRWWIVDADGLVLGRAASQIAHILRGKHKPQFTPHSDTGDFVVVVNAEKVKLTGTKESEKPYYDHSMYPGGLKTRMAHEVREKKPEDLIRRAVQRMIPRSPLGRQMFEKLKVYAGPTHPHQAQRPQALTLPY